MPNGTSGGSRQWSPGRSGSIVIAIAVCVMFILVFLLVIVNNESPRTDHGSMPRKKTVPYGFKFYLYPGSSSHTSWTDVTFQLSSGANTIAWANLTDQDLDSHEVNQTWHYGHPQSLGSMSVWFNVTDLSGNGRLDSGDSIEFTTESDSRFSSDSTYTLTILYEPTDGSMLSLDFTG